MRMFRFLPLIFCFIIFASQAQTVGMIYNNVGTAPGYVLFSPSNSYKAFLIDKCGKEIKEWQSNYMPGLAASLLNDGTLLRCGDLNNSLFLGGGHGGILERFDWNGALQWSFVISDSLQCQHHDAIGLPNGNIMTIVWETHSQEDGIANGRQSLGFKMWSEKIVEIQPIGADSGVIVWQWRAWDHLVQDADSTKLNYGVVADHPELIDINTGTIHAAQPDWLHFNSLAYNEALDQLMVSSHSLSEIFIIDHSTTTEQAALHAGGNAGHGGDLLYRWGNPQNYGRGTSDDKKLFQQHFPHWTDGGNEVMVFNNGVGRPGTDYTSVETFQLPAMVNGSYPIEPGEAYLPAEQDWIYTANPAASFFSNTMGGAERMPNGNTLICNAASGIFMEVDNAGNAIWKYVNPIGINGSTTQGEQPAFNACFRTRFYAHNFSGFAGLTLVPGEPLELDPIPYSCSNIATATETIESINDQATVYPNPFSGSFMLHLPSGISTANIMVLDVAGRILYHKNHLSVTGDQTISLSSYAGMVMILVMAPDQDYYWSTNAIAY